MSDETTQASDVPADDPLAALADQIAEPTSVVTDAAARIVQLPAGVKLATNLDTYEKEKPQEPFWFQHGGEFFHMQDPEDIDFKDLVIGQENPRLMMHILLDEEHRDRFFEKKLPIGKLKKLITDYTQHYGMTDLGELTGSARSSNGTRGR